MTVEEARNLAIHLKGQGATYKEILTELRKRGAIYPRTGRPYKLSPVSRWCREASEGPRVLGDQRGRRQPHLVGLSEEEREARALQMYHKQLQRVRKWRERNPHKAKEYAALYRSL